MSMSMKNFVRKDYYQIPLEDLVIEEGLNIRQNYGDVEELAKSIAINGILVPLIIKREGGKIVVVDGHRRLMAARLANENGGEVRRAPCVLEAKGTNSGDRIVAMMVANSGKPLEPIEEAEAFKRLLALGWVEKEIAERIGKSVQHVKNRLLLNEADDVIRTAVNSGEMAVSAATTLVRITKDKTEQRKMAKNAKTAKEVKELGGKETVLSVGEIKKFLVALEEKKMQADDSEGYNSPSYQRMMGMITAVRVVLGKEKMEF